MASKTLAPLLCLAAVAYIATHGPAFIPGRPLQRPAAASAGAAAAILGAAPALADQIGDAARDLGGESYAFAKEVNWNSGIFLQAPGKFQPLEALKAIDKMIVMGAQADPKLLKAAAEAHHQAIMRVDPNGVPTQGDWVEMNAALGRVFASVPESTVMDVYNAVSQITDPKVPEYMRSLVKAEDADKAYAAFLKFKDVVKANQVAAPKELPVSLPTSDSIGIAANKLATASYPFLKDVDWLSDLYLKPFPGVSATQALKAVDKAIIMGAAMDGSLLQTATAAHHKAITSIDAKGVTSAADYEQILATIGRAVASVPTSKVMDVYNAFTAIVPPTVPNKLFFSVNPNDAQAAAVAFYKFKDVVKASQR